jgi:hypothetical protein
MDLCRFYRLFDIGFCQKFRNYKIVYRRYAGLFFCLCVDANDNELAYLEAIHLFVEILGRLSQLVCHHLMTYTALHKTHFSITFANSIWFSTSTRLAISVPPTVVWCDHHLLKKPK